MDFVRFQLEKETHGPCLVFAGAGCVQKEIHLKLETGYSRIGQTNIDTLTHTDIHVHKIHQYLLPSGDRARCILAPKVNWVR